MKAALFMVVAALALGAALARCPNSCSGHGNCGRYDKCTCWANWQGNDCSLRTCPSDFAWSLDNSDPHYYAECSAKGICDRATGLCDCFDQYEGRGCTRLACPNGCSGHGKCRYVDDLAKAATYTGWDAQKIQVCKCDGGYFGPDCSQRYCPMGDDPMTVCNTNVLQIQTITIDFDWESAREGDSAEDFLTDYSTASPTAEISAVDATAAAAMTVNDEMVLSFTDSHGEVWYTQRIEGIYPDAEADSTAQSIEDALEALPNRAIPSCDAAVVASGDLANLRSWTVTFNDDRNIGTQNLLGCHIAGCLSAGCQPFYKQLRMEKVELASQFITTGAPNAFAKHVSVTADSIFTPVASAVGMPDWTIYVEVFYNDTSDTYGERPKAHSYYAEATSNPSDRTLSDPFVATGIIPVEHSHVSVGGGLYLAFDDRMPEPGWWRFEVATPTCVVTESQAANANREHASCSNRGECDHATGMCACHEGYYGDNCQTQTILF